MRVVKVAAAVVGALLLILLAAAGLVVGTEWGTRTALRAALPLLPDGVVVGATEGRLLDGLRVRDVTVRTDTMSLDIGAAAVRWRPGRLLERHLEIVDLQVAGVRYLRRPPMEEPAAAEPLELPDRIDLPVSVTVQRARVDGVEIYLDPDQDEPQALDRVVLAGRFADARLVLSTLAVQGPGLEVAGEAELVAADDYPLTARLTSRYLPLDFAPVAGTTELAGSVRSLRFRQDVDAPYNVSLAGTVEGLLGSSVPVLAADLRVDDLRLAAVDGELPDATVNLQAGVGGPLDGLEIEAAMTGVDPEQRRFEAELAALVEPEGVLLRRLALTQPGRPGVLRGAGRILLDDGLTADLEIAWQSLQWPLAGEPTLESPRGMVRVTGPPDAYRFEVDARVEPFEQPPLDLDLRGSGNREAATVDLDAAVASGRIGGQVSIVWSPEVDVSVRLQGSGIDPGVVADAWAGAVDFTLTGEVRTRDGTTTAHLENLEAGGRLRGESLSLTARGSFSQVTDVYAADIEQLDLTLGTTALSASGQVGDTVDVRWHVESDDLSELVPAAGGRLSGGGTIVGRYPGLRIDADLQGWALGYQDFVLSALDLTADVDLAGSRQSRIEIGASDGTAGAIDLQHLTVQAHGLPEDHRLELSLVAGDAEVALAMTGRLESPWHEAERWHFLLDDAELRYGELPPWRLDDAAAGMVGAEQVRVERHCWRAAAAELCLDADLVDQALTAGADLRGLTLDYFAAVAPEDLRATGAIDASLQVTRSAAGLLTAQAAVTTTAGRLVLPEAADAGLVGGGALPEVAFEPSGLSLVLDADQARLGAELNLAHGRVHLEAATAAAVITGFEENDAEVAAQPLTGMVEIDVPDLAFVGQLVPMLARPEGSIAGRLELGGTLGEPVSTGRLALRDGAVTLAEPQVRIEEVTVTLEGRARDGFALEAAASSGGGAVTATGMLQLFGEEPLARIDVAGEGFQIMNTDDARIFASPELRVEASGERVAVSGVVRVPRAEVTPGRLQAGAVTVSRDQVLVGEEPDEVVTPREFHAEIRLIPGDQVYFSGFGLTARIEGDLRVIEAPGVPTAATGELRLVDGEYRAYGQGLVIERGRIFFAGPLTEPAVDIEAVRRPREGILVGARVRGPLDDPEFSLFSDPSMPEQEQLAYLVLGRPLDEAPGGEGSALSQAALALGLRGGDAIARNIGERLGVDELTIVTGPDEAGAESDPGQASLVVGTYLSPRLYVSYGIGLFQPGSVLQLQYDISRRWRLVTRSGGEAAGADLLFTLERGRR